MILLKKNIWQQSDSTFLAGQLWFQEKLLTLEELSFLLEKCADFTDFVNLSKQFSGQYSVIFKLIENIWAASDTIGRYPLFYCCAEGQYIVTDSPKQLLKHTSLKEDRYSSKYFKQFGSTPKYHSLIENITPIEAGCIVEFSKQVNLVESNKSLLQQKLVAYNYTKPELAELLNTIFEKYLSPLKNCPVVVPLTAGYDSRLIISQLKKLGFQNVFCFTWGRKNNKEYQTAKEIAKKAGYPYRFIEYNNELVSKYLFDKTFYKYIEYVGNYTSMPYLQDYFAVRFLKDQKLVPEDSIFIQGHSAGAYAGSLIKPWFSKLSKREIAIEILKKYGQTKFTNNAEKELVIDTIEEEFYEELNAPIALHDDWDLNARQSKFVAHSASVFDFFDYKSILPFSDLAFISYFLNAPLKVRFGEQLYRKTLEEFFFKQNGLSYPVKAPSVLKQESKMKTWLKVVLPFTIKQYLYNTEDAIYYREITQSLIKNLKGVETPKSPINFNSYIIQWYVKNIFQTK